MNSYYFHHIPDEPHAHDNKYLWNEDTLTVELYGNCTTGYQWQHSISDPDVLQCIQSTYKPFKPKDCVCKTNVCGAGGLYTMVFTPGDDGFAMLQFKYLRPWEPHAVQKKQLMVNVNKGKFSICEIGNEHFDLMDNMPLYPLDDSTEKDD